MSNDPSTARSTGPSKVTVGLIDFAKLTLLILGDAKSLGHLEELIRSTADIRFSQRPEIIHLRNVDVRLMSDPQRSSVALVNDLVSMKLTEADRNRFANDIAGMIGFNSPCHTYLECECETDPQLEVRVSKGEYDTTVFSEVPPYDSL